MVLATLAAGAIVLAVAAVLFIAPLRRRLTDALSGVLTPMLTSAVVARRGVAGVWHRLFGTILQDGGYIRKAMAGFIVVAVGFASVGLLYAAEAYTTIQGESGPVIRLLVGFMDNPWSYVLALLLTSGGAFVGLRKQQIRMAAQKTGLSYRTVALLAEEIRYASDTNRVIVFDDDSIQETASRIREALAGNLNEQLRDNHAAIERGDLDPEDLTDDPHGDAGEVTALVPKEVKPVPRDDTADESSTGPQTASARYHQALLDFITTLDIDRVVWRFGVPSLLTFGAELILVRLWVSPVWIYLLLALVAMAVGAASYLTIGGWQRRRLRQLRSSPDLESHGRLSVQVKTVSTDDMTVGMGFLSGRRYASRDLDRLAEVLAHRAHQRAEGYQPAPAIEERNAWLLDHYIPLFEEWRQNIEKPRIQDRMVTEVLDSQDGILPKRELAERVIEHDREYIWRGRRFVGMGHDPALVAEVYEELVPAALVETSVDMETVTGETVAIDAVHARTDSMPADLHEFRATFSERFPARKLQSRYELPDVKGATGGRPLIRTPSIPADD